MINLSNEPFVVNDGERVCQMVVARHERIEWEPVASLEETERGVGGFGHTGKK
jgi:dUTP pyrophosphatase